MSAPTTVDVPRRRFTVDEFERMVDAGIFGFDERVELLDGEIVEKPPVNPPHAGVVNRLNRMFVQRVGDRAVLTVQNPLRIVPWSEPEPDFLVARPRDDFYARRHPEPADVLLAVEVADSSLRTDRAVKAPLYARAGITELWIVDVRARAVIVHRRPVEGSYAEVGVAGARLTMAAMPDVVLTLDEIFGAPPGG